MIDREQWEGSSEERRFYRYQLIKGARPGVRFSTGILTYLKFRTELIGPDFTALFEEMTGQALGVAVFNVHRMAVGDYLRIHDDDTRGRKLAFVLYLTPGWQPGFGGSLGIVDSYGITTHVDAVFNRLVTFDVKARTQHYVAPILDWAGSMARLSISGWMLER